MKRTDVKLTQDQANRAVGLMQSDPAQASEYIESCRRLFRLVGEDGILDSIPGDDLKPALTEYMKKRWPVQENAEA